MATLPVLKSTNPANDRLNPAFGWSGSEILLISTQKVVTNLIKRYESPVFAVQTEHGIAYTDTGSLVSPNTAVYPAAAFCPPILPEDFGDPAFCAEYGLKAALMGGAMANAIASVDFVIALGNNGYLGSFGAAGLPPAQVETAIRAIQAALPAGPYAVNLIHTPSEPAIEDRLVDLYLALGVTVIEASAFLGLTESVVRYRVAGLSQAADGTLIRKNRIIAKVSRREVASKFMEPAPEKIINSLLAAGKITSEQANLARIVPLADDVTVEADSGGHTDNRPLVSILPSMLALRDEIQEKYRFATPVRIGAAGGVSTPAAAAAAFAMGAAYVVTGSVNQACQESGTSSHTRNLLAKAAMTDVIMAPSADMFEMGVRVQVLKAGTLFPMRAAKLYELYTRYDSVESIPVDEREKIEKQIFGRSLEDIWQETVRFFQERDPEQIARAEANPKKKMALIFRWYLGLSSRWSNRGEAGREMDYQIWCGPAMGAFNDWVRGTYLEDPANRSVVDVNRHLLEGAAYLQRVSILRLQGVPIPLSAQTYRPEPFQ